MHADRIVLVSDLMENLAKEDKFETNFVREIDNYIERNGLDAPFDPLPELSNGYEAEEILEFDQKAASNSSVIWTTGYKFNFSLVKLPAFDEDEYPLQKSGVTEFPWLYFIGLPFLHTRKSGLLHGVGDDAAYVVEHIALPIVS